VPYDGQTAWREKFHMDDNAVQRLGRSVIRAGVSLPFVLLYALAPKPPGSGSIIATIVAVLLTGLGVRALVQLKTWGVMALGAAGMLLVTVASVDFVQGDPGVLLPALTGALLILAAVPFAAPMARWFCYRRPHG
jgi:purine-cytosine permease-like protein